MIFLVLNLFIFIIFCKWSFLIIFLQIVLPEKLFFKFFLFQIFKTFLSQSTQHFCDTLLVLTTSCLQIVALDHVLQIFVPVDFLCKMSFWPFLCKLSLWIVFLWQICCCRTFFFSLFCLVSFRTTFLQTSFQTECHGFPMSRWSRWSGWPGESRWLRWPRRSRASRWRRRKTLRENTEKQGEVITPSYDYFTLWC